MSPVHRKPQPGDETLAQILDRASEGELAGATIGDFHVERLLGRGGMGEVYLATQLSLNRPVALKVLRPDVLAKPGYRERFEAEAIAVAKLNHPNIVHVYAMSQHDGVHYIAMEYVEGTNLREYIARRGPLDLAQAYSIMKQTGQAIGAAGEAGIIHRDIKPENLLINRRGRVKVADFGLCRQIDEDGPQITQTGITMGTPAYMSPEQAQGFTLDHRSDLYSLGATYYFMLAGVPPFKADSPVAMALKQVREIPSSLLAHRPDLPLEIDRLVMKLMAKNPADRFQSAAEMLAELSKLREVIPSPAAGQTTEAIEAPSLRTEETPRHGPTSPTVPAPTRPRERPAPAATTTPTAPHTQEPGTAPAETSTEADGSRPAARFRGIAATVAAIIGLGAGAAAGWSARSPDVLSMPDESAKLAPALWVDPDWEHIPTKENAEEQIRYALFDAPRENWAAAWLAVPGRHPRAHDAASRAYVQLARLWYRRHEVDALAVLAAELSAWKQAQHRDRDLAALIRIAMDLEKGDLGAVESGFQRLVDTEVPSMYDPTLVSLGLEICADAVKVVRRGTSTQAIEAPLRRAMQRLMLHLNRIELGGPAVNAPRPARAGPNSSN